jgi:hypothetical protein
MTNEERFIGSCNSVGEAEVRARLNADRYSVGKAVWAAAWLDQVEGAKSDATKPRSEAAACRKPGPPFAPGSRFDTARGPAADGSRSMLGVQLSLGARLLPSWLQTSRATVSFRRFLP